MNSKQPWKLENSLFRSCFDLESSVVLLPPVARSRQSAGLPHPHPAQKIPTSPGFCQTGAKLRLRPWLINLVRKGLLQCSQKIEDCQLPEFQLASLLNQPNILNRLLYSYDFVLKKITGITIGNNISDNPTTNVVVRLAPPSREYVHLWITCNLIRELSRVRRIL